MYSDRLKLDIGNFSISKRELNISNLILSNAQINLVQYKGEKDFNFQFIIDEFSSTDTLKLDTVYRDLFVGGLSLENTGFVYRNEHDTEITKGVNYSDIVAENINGNINDIKLNRDTIWGMIDHLSFQEKSGFVLKNLTASAVISPEFLVLEQLKIKTPESDIAATNFSFNYKTYSDYADFNSKIKITAKFEKSKIEMADIAFFAPDLIGIHKSISISGNVNGTINDLKGKNLDIHLGEASQFVGNVDLSGLPNIEETFIHLKIDRLVTTATDLRQIPIPPFSEHKMLEIPENIDLLEKASFKGVFSGFYNDFVTYGQLSTALGEVSSDISLQQDSKKNTTVYRGKVKSSDFNIGKFLALDSYLGKISIDAAIDGQGFERETVKASLKGTVKNIEFNNYNYKNIVVEGDIAKKIFKGILSIKEENIDMDFNGNIDFSESIPALDFVSTINGANLTALKFIKNDTLTTNLSAQLKVQVKGNTVDNLLGEVKINNTVYTQNKNVYKLQYLDLTASETNGVRAIKLSSDFADADISGKLSVMELKSSLNQMLSKYIPSYAVNKKEKTIPKLQDIQWNIQLKKTDALSKLFLPQIKINQGASLTGSYSSIRNQFLLKGKVPQMNLYGEQFENWRINISTENNALLLNTSCEKIAFSDSLWVKGFAMNNKVYHDTIDLRMTWDNNSTTNYKGDISSLITFGKQDKIKIKFFPSEVTIADSVWSINSANEIVVDSLRTITIKDFSFKNKSQVIQIEGVVSENPKDQLQFSLINFNLTNLNSLTKTSGLNLKGTVSGNTSVSDMYNKILFSSSLDFTDFFINDEPLGKGSVRASWNKERDVIDMNGSFSRGIVPNLKFTGLYYPSKKQNNIDIDISVQTIRLQVFEEFIKEYCTNLNGQLSGNLSIKGTLENPSVSGKVKVWAKKIKVNYLNTVYKFPEQEIIINENSFGIENFIVSDENDNKAIVNGKVYHDQFKKIQLDFDVHAQKFMCLNTTESLNNLYYGKAFVTGTINVFGYIDNVSIDASVKTDKISIGNRTEYTRIFIPLSGPEEVSESNFITFIKKDNVSTDKPESNYKLNLSGLQMNFDVEATPDAEVQLIFDSKNGDIIRGKGRGNIKMQISTLGDFNMYGSYVIEEGDYLFTLQNIINKKFKIEKGGVIKWNGIPYDADVNLSAIYQVKTSLSPFSRLEGDSSKADTKRYPVNCKLLMTGNLLTPAINFDIDLPGVDENTKQTVKGYINTEQEMNKQIFSLLVLNSFVTPAQIRDIGISETNRGITGSAATSTELLSNQLSNWLSQISNDFDIGVNYRPGDQLSSDELEVALSTQLFNERMNIDGNVGVSNNNQNANNIVGDVNVEYKISEDGKFRVKAFNKANNNILVTANAPYTQGIGVFYREEFNTFEELYKRYLSKLKKK